MGFALSWIGIRGTSPDVVLAELGWRRTGEQEDVAESPVVCARLGTGWFIILMNDSMDAFDGTIDPAPLSRGTEVVTCMVEEHVMVSGFSKWKDGKQVLAVSHNPDAGSRQLDVRGSLSPELKQIVDDALGSQENEDAGHASTDFVFDVAIDMACRLTGFRHDLDVDGATAMFDVLERVAPPTRKRTAWWSALFRKRDGR